MSDSAPCRHDWRHIKSVTINGYQAERFFCRWCLTIEERNEKKVGRG